MQVNLTVKASGRARTRAGRRRPRQFRRARARPEPPGASRRRRPRPPGLAAAAKRRPARRLGAPSRIIRLRRRPRRSSRPYRSRSISGGRWPCFSRERQRPTLETPGPPDRLPTEHELSSAGRIGLESGRLKALLTRLKSLLEANSGASIEFPPIDLTNAPKPSRESGQIILETADLVTLQTANLDILKWLACAGREYGVAYQLGRSLRDTANPPPHPGAAADQGQPEIKTRVAEIIASPQWQAEQDKKRLPAEARPAEAEKQAKAEAARQALRHQLARPRASTLQGWLATLAPYLPANTAAIVSVSIGRWCDLVSTIFDPATPGNLRRLQAPSKLNARSYRAPSKLDARSYQAPSQLEVAPELIGSLLPQGDAWINLLVRHGVHSGAPDTGRTGRGGRGRSLAGPRGSSGESSCTTGSRC